MPHGFRLDVDAAPDEVVAIDGKKYDMTNLEDVYGNKIDVSGKQEADDIDPLRLNAGWGYSTNRQDKVTMLDAMGHYQPRTTVKLQPSVTNNAPAIGVSTSVIDTPAFYANSRFHNRVELETDGSDPDVHVNHFVSATPRYDDTKYVETERSRAGFLRTSECPVLALDITQGYFAGSGTSGYKWTTDLDKTSINQQSSRMMRFKIVLSNLSNDQMEALGYLGYEQDNCSNPQISQVMPAIDGYGPANMMLPGDLQYVSYEDLQADKELAKPKYGYFDWSYESKKPEGSSRPAPNIDAEKPIWTYYIADMTDYLDVASVDTTVTSSTPRMNDPVLGSAFIMGDRAMKTSETVYDNTTRKFASWSFSGQLNRRPMYNEDGSPNRDRAGYRRADGLRELHPRTFAGGPGPGAVEDDHARNRGRHRPAHLRPAVHHGLRLQGGQLQALHRRWCPARKTLPAASTPTSPT